MGLSPFTGQAGKEIDLVHRERERDGVKSRVRKVRSESVGSSCDSVVLKPTKTFHYIGCC